MGTGVSVRVYVIMKPCASRCQPISSCLKTGPALQHKRPAAVLFQQGSGDSQRIKCTHGRRLHPETLSGSVEEHSGERKGAFRLSNVEVGLGIDFDTSQPQTHTHTCTHKHTHTCTHKHTHTHMHTQTHTHTCTHTAHTHTHTHTSPDLLHNLLWCTPTARSQHSCKMCFIVGLSARIK